MSFKQKAKEYKEELKSEYYAGGNPQRSQHPPAKPIRQAISRPKSTYAESKPLYKDHAVTLRNAIQTPEVIALQTPIFINRKVKSVASERQMRSKQRVEPFVPIDIPGKKESKLQNTSSSLHQTKEVEIIIEKDHNKNCMKKLCHKIKMLTEELKQCQNQRDHLVQLVRKLRLERNNPSIEAKLQELENQLQTLRRENQRLHRECLMNVPQQVIKEIVIEKPVEVQVEVPKYLPGPERIIEKIVEVPDCRPTAPCSCQDRVIEVPVEVPVYIQKHVYDTQMQAKLDELTIEVDELVAEIEKLRQENQDLKENNQTLRYKNKQLAKCLECQNSKLNLLKKHNEEKNRNVEQILKSQSIGRYLDQYY